MLGGKYTLPINFPLNYPPLNFIQNAEQSSITYFAPEICKIKRNIDGTGSEITTDVIRALIDINSYFVEKNASSISKLKEMKKCLGLNVTELANIMGVKRPTIYQWIEENNQPSLRKKNRIDKIYGFLKPLIENNAFELRKTFHDEGQNGESLYTLLKKGTLKERVINIAIQDVLKKIMKEKLATKRYELVLQNMGFESVNKERKKKALDDLIRTIG